MDTQISHFQTIPNDPIQVLQHTLSNGMRMYMSINADAPRIFTNIAVRAGSKHDPADTTGLAHYMEHMLFKGTSKIGATNWEEEQVLLQQISDLYEEYRQTTDEVQRTKLYTQIDQISNQAAKLVAANEYDKLASSIGAKATNAYTWVEQTVYVNDIPSNELERWMKLESERFRMMALRLFHTELETVYEEFNISQDRDFRKANQAIREGLFPSHPYGTRTTLGSAEHLRNPSQKKIHEFFHTYYVPNNMAILLAGDFDPAQAIEAAEQYFGTYQTRTTPSFTFENQPTLTAPIRKEVYGKEAPYVELAWRFGGSQTNDPFMIQLLRNILYNQQAGIMDEQLTQQQKVLEANAWTWVYEDYSVFGLFGKAREGQSLAEVEQLLADQVALLKAGEFDDWLIEAAIKDLRLQEIQAFENNQSRVHSMTTSFILGIPWDRMVGRYDWMTQLTKADIVAFANTHLHEGHVVVNKHQGIDPNKIKVEKPPINAVEVNRTATSTFAADFLQHSAPKLHPVFADFAGGIRQIPIRTGLTFDYVPNTQNELFRLDFIFDMGKSHSRELSIALAYLPYLGTSKYSPAELQRAFFKLGIFMNVNAYDERSYITVSGLNESLKEGIALINHIFQDLQTDELSWKKLATDIVLRRQHAQKDRNVILRQAMGSYAKYGAASPFQFRLSEKEIRALTAQGLTDWIKSLPSFQHRLYYYGPSAMDEVVQLLEQHYQLPATLKPLPTPQVFEQLPTASNRVFFVDFPIVQTDVLMLSKGTPQFNLEEYLLRDWYNEYFGYGLSSIVFQEIRESKALAYSTYAMYSNPQFKDQAHYLQAYVGTQPDKLRDAIPTLIDLTENMPQAERLMEHSRTSILKRIESSRIPASKLFWEAQSIRDLGQQHDLQQDIYQTLQSASAKTLIEFQEQYVKGRAFHFMILGDQKRVDLEYLRSFGPLEILSMEQLFGH
ncbi:MAG: insulinase family protein [Bacteroidota bacterium]